LTPPRSVKEWAAQTAVRLGGYSDRRIAEIIKDALSAYAAAQVAQARGEEREACATMIPTTWLDPLLTGEGAVLKGYGPWDGKQVERLLQAIAAAIRARTTVKRVYNDEHDWEV